MTQRSGCPVRSCPGVAAASRAEIIGSANRGPDRTEPGRGDVREQIARRWRARIYLCATMCGRRPEQVADSDATDRSRTPRQIDARDAWNGLDSTLVQQPDRALTLHAVVDMDVRWDRAGDPRRGGEAAHGVVGATVKPDQGATSPGTWPHVVWRPPPRVPSDCGAATRRPARHTA